MSPVPHPGLPRENYYSRRIICNITVIISNKAITKGIIYFMQTLNDIITNIHSTTASDSEKGKMFEALCLYFLKHDKLYASAFSDVSLWKNSPVSNGQPDTGIDITAKIIGKESYCAVQCKFRDDDSSISKKEIDSFLAASSKSHFSQRILFTLTGNFGRNARCLCEGVDVPALDAIIFLSPKSSEIDIVQSVGRVMRKSPGKKYGYVILPVIVYPGETPEYALDK